VTEGHWWILAWFAGWFVTHLVGRWSGRLAFPPDEEDGCATILVWPVVLPLVLVAHWRRGKKAGPE